MKLCLNLYSLRTLRGSRNFGKCLTPIISFIPYIGFPSVLIIIINLRLNLEIDYEFFYFIIQQIRLKKRILKIDV